jgi:hypothetical protein
VIFSGFANMIRLTIHAEEEEFQAHILIYLPKTQNCRAFSSLQEAERMGCVCV